MQFMITADYTPQAISALRNNPNTNRREAAQQLLESVNAKLIAFYGRTANGPGALVIFETDDPTVPPALLSVAGPSGTLQNISLERLLNQEETVAIRQTAQKAANAYRQPGQ